MQPNLVLVEGEGDAMKVKLTEEGKKATEQYATTHDLPNGTTRKKVKTELDLVEGNLPVVHECTKRELTWSKEVHRLKKENELLGSKLMSVQNDFDEEKSGLVEQVKTLNDELASVRQRASKERTMLQSQIDVLLSKVQVGEPAITASHVQELLKGNLMIKKLLAKQNVTSCFTENIELTKQANLDKAKIELLEERLSKFNHINQLKWTN